MNNMKQESGKVVTHWPPLIMGIGLARKIEELEHDEEVGLPCFGLGKQLRIMNPNKYCMCIIICWALAPWNYHTSLVHTK